MPDDRSSTRRPSYTPKGCPPCPGEFKRNNYGRGRASPRKGRPRFGGPDLLSSVRGKSVRVVVVGASSGLGRCIGVGLAQGGAEVALLARRRERLVDAAKEAGAGALAIECDVTDPESCRAAIAEAAAGLGGIDGLVYTPGIGPLVRLEAHQHRPVAPGLRHPTSSAPRS